MQVAVPTSFRLAGLLAISFSIVGTTQSSKWLGIAFGWYTNQKTVRNPPLSFLS